MPRWPFRLNKKSYAWLQHYKKLRTFVIQQHGLAQMNEQASRFFLLWSGRPVSCSSAPHLLRRFFITINCEEMKITCISVRHAISGRNYDESLDHDRARDLKSVDPNIAALLDSSKVAMQLSDAEAEEDCGEREPYSEDEEDAAVASDSSGYVPSRPTRTPAVTLTRNNDKDAAECSAARARIRVSTRTSSFDGAEDTAENDTGVQASRSPFEFLDDDVTEEHSSSEVSTHWRLIALDRVHWPAMRRRQMVARDANLDRSNPPMTAERLLLWVGIQSKLLLQLDTTHGLDSFAAYKASRIVMCPENAHRYDPSNEVIPFDADNQLSKLLMAAYGDAYHRKRKASVVIVLKPAVGIAAVVLLGEAISPSSPQRYSCCVSYNESAQSCYAVSTIPINALLSNHTFEATSFQVRKCPLNTEGPTLSEEFCRAELLHFRTKNHDMWTDLLYKKNLEFSYVLNIMRQYHALQSLCTKKFTNDGAQRSNPRWDTKADQPLLKKPRTRST
ncbi:hypothetical protein OSTOST_15492, partial [Ostertagia ostertagi]